MGKRVKLLVAVKTYPVPTAKHGESVCTGGFLEDGSFIRLHPIDFRSKSGEEKFKLYQWIELEIEKSIEDKRPESFNPRSEITLLNQVKDWQERKRTILTKPTVKMCDLNNTTQHEVSVGVVPVRELLEFTFESRPSEWRVKQKVRADQGEVFYQERTQLRKIPFSFKLHYRCEHPECNTHNQTLVDWQVGVVYLKALKAVASEDEACNRVCKQFHHWYDTKSRDLFLLVGTIPRFGKYIIGGIFNPPKDKTNQETLLKLLTP